MMCRLIINKFLAFASLICCLFVLTLVCARGSYAQTAPAAQWNFDEGAGTTAASTAGRVFNGTLIGSAAWARPGKTGPAALDLPGDSCVDVPAPAVDTAASYTVSAWVKVHKLGGYQTFVSIDGNQISGFFLQLRASGNFAFAVPAADAAQQVTVAVASMTVQPDVWYNLIGVHDAQAKTLTLYIDGVKQQTVSLPTSWSATGHTEIGRGKYDGKPVDFVDGEIDDVALYSGVYLDPAAMRQMAKQTDALAPTLTLHLDRPGAALNPAMYGLMIEDINHAVDGGLYAELIRNRSFADDPKQPAHWQAATDNGNGTITLDPSQPIPGTALTTSLRLDIVSVEAGGRVGAANDGYWGIPVKPATRYRASFYAKSDTRFSGPVTVSLESADHAHVYAAASLPALSTAWKEYNVSLVTSANITPSTNNVFVVSGHRPGSLWLNQVSLFPPTWNNRPNGTRPDLMRLLMAMQPKFLRMPGGNYLEGNDLPNRFDWKKTIGPLSQRPGHADPWGYRSSDGFGLLEYLEWCEDLHMEPLLAVFAGFTLNHTQVKPGPDLAPYVQDALDEVQYVTGSIKTPWGARRAQDGHAAPFPLTYVEIGNEDFFDTLDSYNGRFAQFYDAFRANYPHLKLISTRNDVMSRVPDVVDDHFYEAPADFEGDIGHYDRHSRGGPAVFVGEYASQEGKPTPDLNAALGDAAFMIGMEHNADVVRLASYAPLLVNVNMNASQWGTNLIGFDALRSYGSPSYYVQKLFSIYHGDTVIPVTLSGGSGVFAAACYQKSSHYAIIKFVNAIGSNQTITITLAGATTVARNGSAIVMHSDTGLAANSLDQPSRVAPNTIALAGLSKQFSLALPPYSVGIVEVKVSK